MDDIQRGTMNSAYHSCLEKLNYCSRVTTHASGNATPGRRLLPRFYIFYFLLQVYFSFIMERNGLLISLTSISKREFLSLDLAGNRISLSTKSNADKSVTNLENQNTKRLKPVALNQRKRRQAAGIRPLITRRQSLNKKRAEIYGSS